MTFEGTVFVWFGFLFALAALALGENLVFLMGCVALGCGLAARPLARRNVMGLEVRRHVPARARVGIPVSATYEVVNPRRRPAVGLEVSDRPASGIRPVALTLEVAGIDPGQSLRKATRLLFLRRGLFELGALKVTSAFPLGFFRVTTEVPSPATVLVRPREGRPTAALRSCLAGRTESSARPSLTVGGDDILHGVREYRHGDDPRRIHWRTSARRRALTVTEWRTERGQRVVLLLGRGKGAGVGAARTFERAVSAVATLFRTAHRQGVVGHLELGLGRGRPPRSLGAGLDALGMVRAQAGRRPRAALRRLGRHPTPRTVIYVASGPEPGVRRRLRRAAGRGGTWLLLSVDEDGGIERWVRGLS